MRQEMEAVKHEMKVIQALLLAERAASVDALASSQREIGRLSAELGRVRTDLAVQQAQFAEMVTKMRVLQGRSDPLAS